MDFSFDLSENNCSKRLFKCALCCCDKERLSHSRLVLIKPPHRPFLLHYSNFSIRFPFVVAVSPETRLFAARPDSLLASCSRLLDMEQKLACLQDQPDESFISLDKDAGVKSHSQRQGHVRAAPLPHLRLSAAEKR